MHEKLLVSYTGLTGQSTNCTELFGITELPRKMLSGGSEEDLCVCLVF
jgi:hypothetical protein